MPKRKLATSPLFSGSACSLPLTENNLLCLQESLRPLPSSSAMSRTSSPTGTKKNLDARTKLEAYRVHIDAGHEYPPALAHHIRTVLRRPRDGPADASPNAKKIVKMRRHAAAQNERTGVNEIAPYLLFVGEADFDDRARSVPHITMKQDIGFNKFFLPPAPSNHVKETWGKLSSPQPDSCLGYVTRSDAQAAGCTAPFTATEESILHRFSLTQYMHFPFLTAQWKVPNSNENLATAQNQAARDGAAIVNHLHELHLAANGSQPSAVQTCHFSIQSDLQHGGLWVHWRDGDEHYMELEYDFSMRNQADLEHLRGFLHNILDYALDERLETIKAALPKLAETLGRGRYPTIRPAENNATPPESSETLSVALDHKDFRFDQSCLDSVLRALRTRSNSESRSSSESD